LTFLDVLHPSTIYSDWDIMFCFTRDRTSMATDTIAVVDYKTKIQKSSFFRNKYNQDLH